MLSKMFSKVKGRSLSSHLKALCLRGAHPTKEPSRTYARDIKFGNEAKMLMLEGVDKISDAVSLTLGPKGRNVIIKDRRDPGPRVTKDGATVAKSVSLPDGFQNQGARLVQNVTENCNKKAGDGTTTATVLARAIAKDGFNHITSGVNPIEMRKGLMNGVKVVTDYLTYLSKPLVTSEEIMQVASNSANGDTSVGKLIAEAMDRVGRDGVITVKEGKSMDDRLEVVNGMRFESGYISPFFVNVPKGLKVNYKDCYIMFCDMKFSEVRSILPLLEFVHKKRQPLVIIADDIEGDALSAMVLNRLQIGLPIVGIKAPWYGEHRKYCIQDMATLTGGVFFGDEACEKRLADINENDFGRVKEVIISKEESIFLEGNGDKNAVEERAQMVRDELKECDNTFQMAKLKDRLARLLSAVAIIHVGGVSEVEVNEKKDRLEDALNATRAAVEEGVVPGGGTALVRCIEQLKKVNPLNDDQKKGIDILINALTTPCKTIAKNAGKNPGIVIEKVLNMKRNEGYDAFNDSFTDLMEAGIMDPTKVVKTALQDAAGVASMLTTAEAVVTYIIDAEITTS